MKKLLVAAVFVAGLCGGSFGTELVEKCYYENEEVQKLLAKEYEIGMMARVLQGRTSSAEILFDGYIDTRYAIDCSDVDDCINKLKPRYKELFKQKGLKWSEANIKAEYKKIEGSRLRLYETCRKKAEKAKAVLD